MIMSGSSSRMDCRGAGWPTLAGTYLVASGLGMAYAELAGLPPITGLYTSILCLLRYAVSGADARRQLRVRFSGNWRNGSPRWGDAVTIYLVRCFA